MDFTRQRIFVVHEEYDPEGKSSTSFSYTKTPLLFKSLHLLYLWGLGISRGGDDLDAREFQPHHCVVIETMFVWRMGFIVATGSRAKVRNVK